MSSTGFIFHWNDLLSMLVSLTTVTVATRLGWTQLNVNYLLNLYIYVHNVCNIESQNLKNKIKATKITVISY